MDMIGKVKRMHFRDRLSFSDIARRTGLSRNTVKKWVKAPAEVEPRYRRKAVAGKLSAFEEALVQMLRADARRAKHERRTARALHTELKALGYEGGYSRLTDFIRAWREGEGQAVNVTAYVPLNFELGEAFQFDWSEEGLVVGGIYYRVQVAHTKLCASRAFWLVAYPSQGHEMLFDAHTRSFAALGGVARRGIYDNMRTAVDKVHKGKGRTVNARFAVMCAHYLYDPDFCNVASGWEKGRVEKNVQDSRRRIWIEAARRRFSSFAELNAWLGERCRALWSEVRHPEHSQFSVAEMLEHERPHLMPMPEPFDGYVEKPARVSSTCLVSVARNRYSVPCEWAGQMVSTRLYPSSVAVVADDVVVARHERLSDSGGTRYDWQHYIPLVQRKPGALRKGAPFADMPEALQQLRRGLLRQAGGDRVMAQVLAARRLPVFNTPDVLTDAVADLALFLVLAAARGATSAEAALRRGGWGRWAPTLFLGRSLGGLRLGIFGMGRIGQAIALRATAFGLRVHYHNRTRLAEDKERGAQFHESLESLLSASDVFCICAPSTPQIRGSIESQRLALLPRGAIVVNVARGDLVDEAALFTAVQEGRVGAVGTDVYRGEPNIDARWLELSNATLLPHIGSATHEVRTAMGMLALDGIHSHFGGVPASNLLNPQAYGAAGEGKG